MGGMLAAVDEGMAAPPSQGEEESKEDVVKANLLKTVNIINSGFYLVISLLFSSEKEWQQEKHAWLEVATT